MGQNYKHRRAVYELTHRGKTMVAEYIGYYLKKKIWTPQPLGLIRKKLILTIDTGKLLEIWIKTDPFNKKPTTWSEARSSVFLWK